MNQVITYTEQKTERDSTNEIHALVHCSFLLDVLRLRNAEVYISEALTEGNIRKNEKPVPSCSLYIHSISYVNITTFVRNERLR